MELALINCPADEAPQLAQHILGQKLGQNVTQIGNVTRYCLQDNELKSVPQVILLVYTVEEKIEAIAALLQARELAFPSSVNVLYGEELNLDFADWVTGQLAPGATP